MSPVKWSGSYLSMWVIWRSRSNNSNCNCNCCCCYTLTSSPLLCSSSTPLISASLSLFLCHHTIYYYYHLNQWNRQRKMRSLAKTRILSNERPGKENLSEADIYSPSMIVIITMTMTFILEVMVMVIILLVIIVIVVVMRKYLLWATISIIISI